MTGWDIDILTPAEYDKNVDQMEQTFKGVEGVEDVMLDKMLAIGVISLGDLAEVGPEPLVNELKMSEELAAKVIEVAAEAAKRYAVEAEAAKQAAAEAAKKAAEEAALRGETPEDVAAGEAARAKREPLSAEKREAALIADLAAGWRAAQRAEQNLVRDQADDPPKVAEVGDDA